MSTHYGTTARGEEYEIQVSQSRRFHNYDTHGFERVDVCVEDGAITPPHFLPDEMSPWQARVLAAMLMDAADAKEVMDGPRYELTDAGRAMVQGVL